MNFQIRNTIIFLVSILGVIATSMGVAEERKPGMSKSIEYRGGVVVFSIPSHWKEEYKPTGGATFYDDHPDAGTLRLSVLSFKSTDTQAEQMALGIFNNESHTLLANGFPLSYTVSDGVEGKERLHIHTWKIGVPVPPKSVRVILFTHTVLASQEKDNAIRAELDYLDRSIRAAKFSQAAGIAGSYQHE